jgi:carbamoyl-phosphate synthase large subunit
MVSTGEVAGFGESFEEALMKALVASGMKIPGKGAPVLLSVGGEKDRAVIIAEKMVANGYEIYATEHTAEALRENGVDCVKVYKVSEAGVPNIRDLLSERVLKLVINIPSPEKGASEITDGYLIRRRAVEFGVPIVTNMALAERLASAL